MFLAPWTPLLSSPNRPQDFHGIDGIPTLRQLSNLEVELLPEIERRLDPEGDARGEGVA